MASAIENAPVSVATAQSEQEFCETPQTDGPYKTDLMILNDLATLHSLFVQFDELGEQGPDNAKTFFIKVQVGDISGRGLGMTKQQAKLHAAQEVVGKLKKLPVPSGITPYWCKPKKDLVDILDRPDFFKDKDPVTCLVQIQQCRREAAPEIDMIWCRFRGVIPIEFWMQVTVGQLKTEAVSHNKKAAKFLAAERMIYMMGLGAHYSGSCLCHQQKKAKKNVQPPRQTQQPFPPGLLPLPQHLRQAPGDPSVTQGTSAAKTQHKSSTRAAQELRTPKTANQQFPPGLLPRPLLLPPHMRPAWRALKPTQGTNGEKTPSAAHVPKTPKTPFDPRISPLALSQTKPSSPAKAITPPTVLSEQ